MVEGPVDAARGSFETCHMGWKVDVATPLNSAERLECAPRRERSSLSGKAARGKPTHVARFNNNNNIIIRLV